MTFSCRISSSERTGPRASAAAAPGTASARKTKKARLVRQAFSCITPRSLTAAQAAAQAPAQHAHRHVRVRAGIDIGARLDIGIARVVQGDGDIGYAAGHAI